MLKKQLLIITLLTVSIAFSQDKKIPEGWDLITLEGKPAYMNLITGDVSKTLPKHPAKKPMKKVELDATILHKVKKGETLYAIARKNNISINDIYRLNAQFDYNNIKVGQEIVVGYDKNKEGKVTYVVDEDAYINPSNNNVHIVQKGETLFRIAKKYHITVSKLKEINNLESNNLRVNQKLKIK